MTDTGPDAAPVPTPLVAVTEQLCITPLVRPLTTMGDALPPADMPPGLHVAVYEVIALPPLLPGGVKLIVACALPPVAVPMVGAPGAVVVSETLRVACVAARKFALPD